MRCPSLESPRLAIAAPRHNAPLGRYSLRSTHAGGKPGRQHLSTPNWLRENMRPREYAHFAAIAGKSLISKVFMINIVGMRVELSRFLRYSITKNSV